MNCINWEERVALYAGGDLNEAGATEVGRHLDECGECRVFAAALNESLQFVREAHRQTISPVHFTAVRARVLAELERSPLPWWRNAWFYGLTTVVAALFILLVRYPSMPPPPPRIALSIPSAPAEPLLAAPAPQVTRVRHVRPLRRATRPLLPSLPAATESGPPVVVKLVTEDPNVVIYWITDNSGE